MGYALLADLVVAFHLGYVGFVVVGEVLILLGLLFRWGWVRNEWFRMVHLIAIAIVAGESLLNVQCPLTDLETSLRILGGQEAQAGTFVGRLMHNLFICDDLDFDHWAFRAGYVGFALLVLLTLLLAPPRWRHRPTAAVTSS